MKSGGVYADPPQPAMGNHSWLAALVAAYEKEDRAQFH
jgi:hypothetical protein